MKQLFFLITLLPLLSCNSNRLNSTNSASDSLGGYPSEAAFKKHFMDSVEKASKKELIKSLIDTAGLFKAPVKILNARLVKKEYSNYRDIQLTYKNVSAKKIEGIKFEWYGTNAFKEPADMGNTMLEGFGGGFSDDVLRPKESTTSTWSILSRDGKKVVIAWPTEVAFSDGSSWKLKD